MIDIVVNATTVAISSRDGRRPQVRIAKQAAAEGVGAC
jgi:hypothetical protein